VSHNPFEAPPESMDRTVILAHPRDPDLSRGDDVAHTYRAGFVRTHWPDFDWWLPLPPAPIRAESPAVYEIAAA